MVNGCERLQDTTVQTPSVPRGGTGMQRLKRRRSATETCRRRKIHGMFGDLVLGWRDKRRTRLVRWCADQIQSQRFNRQGPGNNRWEPNVLKQLRAMTVDHVFVLADSLLQASKLSSADVPTHDFCSDVSRAKSAGMPGRRWSVVSQQELLDGTTLFSNRVALINAGLIVDFERVAKILEAAQSLLIVDIFDRETAILRKWSRYRLKSLRKLPRHEVITSRSGFLPFVIALQQDAFSPVTSATDHNDSLRSVLDPATS
jgi:hypothetical protein